MSSCLCKTDREVYLKQYILRCSSCHFMLSKSSDLWFAIILWFVWFGFVAFRGFSSDSFDVPWLNIWSCPMCILCVCFIFDIILTPFGATRNTQITHKTHTHIIGIVQVWNMWVNAVCDSYMGLILFVYRKSVTILYLNKFAFYLKTY